VVNCKDKLFSEFKKMRLSYGLTQAEAATLLDRPLITVASWDNGSRKCHKRVLTDLQLRYAYFNAQIKERR